MSLATTIKPWATRFTVRIGGKVRSVALDQIRMVDHSRLTKKLAEIDPAPALERLQQMFAP